MIEVILRIFSDIKFTIKRLYAGNGQYLMFFACAICIKTVRIVYELKHKLITVYDITVNKIELPLVDVTITCSKGTYIRSLADEFGRSLGNGAYLKSLRRTRSGEADICKAVKLDEFVEYMGKIIDN
ncbi:MAG: hypothetical protein II060_15070 [Bacteroidales bacterium]|nr:hypothetical protein [Bacteroidales bacterium]